MLLTSCSDPITETSSTEPALQQSSDTGSKQLSGYTLNGVSFEEYKIVYAEDAYGYGREFARMLRSGIIDNTGGIIYNEEKGEWEFTTTTHTGVDVPVYAMGYGTETFNGKTVDNTDISKFVARIMGESNWETPKTFQKQPCPNWNEKQSALLLLKMKNKEELL